MDYIQSRSSITDYNGWYYEDWNDDFEMVYAQNGMSEQYIILYSLWTLFYYIYTQTKYGFNGDDDDEDIDIFRYYIQKWFIIISIWSY